MKSPPPKDDLWSNPLAKMVHVVGSPHRRSMYLNKYTYYPMNDFNSLVGIEEAQHKYILQPWLLFALVIIHLTCNHFIWHVKRQGTKTFNPYLTYHSQNTCHLIFEISKNISTSSHQELSVHYALSSMHPTLQSFLEVTLCWAHIACLTILGLAQEIYKRNKKEFTE